MTLLQKQTMPRSQRTDCIYGYFPLSNTVSQGVYNNPDASTLTTPKKQYLAGFLKESFYPSGIPNDNP